MACRFPNPIPSGTRVPQWALIDITVRCYVFFNDNIFTVPSTGSLREIGTQTSLSQSAVRTFSLSFSHYQCFTPTSCILDTPEQAPGVLLGSSGATVSATGGATSSLFGETSSAVNPTSGTSSSSSPASKSSSNTGAIVGGVVGGVAVISLAAIAIFFFRRQRRPEAPAPVAPSVFGASQPPMDEVQQPLTMDDRYTTSSFPGTIGSSIPGTPGATMRIYVSVSCRCASMCRVRSSYPFDTQDPNDPSTFPGYQGIPQTPASPQGTVPSFNGYQGVPETPTSPPLGIVPSFNGTNGTGNSLATMQTSRPQGYHGLPTV
jgi:hypothetical protein